MSVIMSNSLGLRASIGQVSASLRPVQPPCPTALSNRPVQQAISSVFLEYITLIQDAILHRFRQSIPSIQQTFLLAIQAEFV